MKLDSNQKSLKCKCLIRRSSLFFFQTNFGVCVSIKKFKTFQTLYSKIKHYIFYEELQIFSQERHSLSHKITSLVSLCQSLFHCQSFKFKDLLTSQNAYRHLCAIYQLSQCNTYIRWCSNLFWYTVSEIKEIQIYHLGTFSIDFK